MASSLYGVFELFRFQFSVVDQHLEDPAKGRAHAIPEFRRVATELDSEYCTVRTRIPAGIISSGQLKGIAAVAEKYGTGAVHLTTRQTIEIPHTNHADLDAVANELAANNTPVGSERDEVVNVIACPGTERCIFANIDSISLARSIDAKLFGKEMPVKIRISVSACPNVCTSPLLNEIGIVGQNRPIRVPGMCTGCGTCVEYCKEEAITIKRGISVLDPSRCVECGICVRSCPYNLLIRPFHPLTGTL